MRRFWAAGAAALFVVGIAAPAAAKSAPPETFETTVSRYVKTWNSLTKGLVDGTTLQTSRRARGVFGNEVSPGVPVYMVAKSRKAPLQAVMVPIKTVDGSLETPTKLLAGIMANIYPDIVTQNELLDAFKTTVLPALDNVPLASPVTVNDLLDFHADVVGSTVVFAFTPVGAPVPSVKSKVAALAKVIPVTTTTVAPNLPTISLDEFNQLQSGMTYAQASQIIGSPGTLQSQSDIGDYHTVSYKWDGPAGSFGSAFIIFQNDALQSKSQFGLK